MNKTYIILKAITKLQNIYTYISFIQLRLYKLINLKTYKFTRNFYIYVFKKSRNMNITHKVVKLLKKLFNTLCVPLT